MEDEHSISNNNNSNDIVQMSSSSSTSTSSSNARRVHIRRGVFRQTTTLRSSPYNPSLSNLRRRRQQTSRITSETISNLITNIENPPDVNTSLIDPEEIDVFLSESEIVQDHFLVTSDDENPTDQFEVLADFSQTSPTDSTMINEHHHDEHEHDESYHSISTIDFDPEEEDDDDDDDDDHHRYYYTSRSIPVFDYSSSTEPLIVHNHPIDMTQEQYDDAYSPSINDDEDLSIEIILESSQNNSLPILTPPPPPPRRRRSIIPAHIQHNRGLRSSDILSIPQKMYSSLKEQLHDKYQSTTMINTQCYICLEDFQSIDSIKILHCQHIFHTRCVNEWLRHHSNCAYCRTPVVVDILRSSSATINRRQRTRVRRNHNTISRSSTNGSIEQTSSESFPSEQQ